MIKFIKFFEADIDPNLNQKEYIYNYLDKYIIRTNHIKDRYDDSKRAVTKKKKLQLFKKVIIHCKENGKKNQVYIFFVESTSVGMIVHYREDKYKKVKGNQCIMVTWLGDVRKPPISKTIHTFELKKDSDMRVLLEESGINYKDVETVIL